MFIALARQRPKAPLCKGGCQKSLIFDWGIVVLSQPLRSKSKILTTSPYTGEARASRSILLDKLKFEARQKMPPEDFPSGGKSYSASFSTSSSS